jgi:predicted outer membrane repeat protein
MKQAHTEQDNNSILLGGAIAAGAALFIALSMDKQ